MPSNYGLTEEQLQDLRTWTKVQKRVIQFQNKATPALFNEIFGEATGFPLFEHFRNRCNNDYQKFNTYLDVDQHNKVLAHIMTSMYYDP